MSPARVFAREATGLVRQISTFDSFCMNFANMSVAMGLLTYTTASYVFPGSDPIAATILATVFSVFVSLMYTLVGWAMPRSGADYVFMSRVLHPAVGFVASWHLVFWYMFFVGILANWVTTLAISPSLLAVGTVTSNQWLVDVANITAQPQNVLIIGLLVIVMWTALMLRGARVVFTVNNIMVILAIIGVAVTAWLLATNTNADFVRAFSRYGSYEGVIAAAHAAGYSPQGPNPFLATLGVMPYVYFSTGFGIITTYFGGEIKAVKKNLFYSQMLAVFVVGGMLAVLGALSINVFGSDFLGSITQLGYSGAPEYPFTVPPFFNLFVSLLTTEPAIIWVIAISFIAAIAIVVGCVYIIGTRSIFAWAFDRVVPTKFATLDDRTHAPVYAIIVVALVQTIGLAGYTYGSPTFLSLASGASLVENFVFMIVCVAAIAYPFVQKESYERSMANVRVGGIPLICIAGVVSFVFYSIIQYFFITNPLYGANLPVVWEAAAVSVFSGLAVLIGSYYYHKAKGADLFLAFKEIPPE